MAGKQRGKSKTRATNAAKAAKRKQRRGAAGLDPQQARKIRAREREAQKAALAARLAVEAAEREMASEKSQKQPSRLRLALLNAWNLVALGAVGALAFATKSPAPLIVGASLEAGWLAFASRPRVSHLLFAKKHEALAEATAHARRAAMIATLSETDADRVRRLDERRGDILKLSGDHQHLGREVLLAELSRLEDVVDSFIDLAATSRRWEAYLGSIDVEDLESETRRFEEDATRAADEEQRALARKNLEVLLRRREQVDELRKKIQRTRAQLDLIESTFRMIANEIMLMRSTEELRGQLDDLVVGVQAVREMTGDATTDAASGATPSSVARSETETERARRAGAAANAAAAGAASRRG